MVVGGGFQAVPAVVGGAEAPLEGVVVECAVEGCAGWEEAVAQEGGGGWVGYFVDVLAGMWLGG